jgi:hypothetical protein
MAAATADLMAAGFGMGGYDSAALGELFGLLRGLRVAAGDFVPAEGGAGRGAAAASATGPATAASAARRRR